MTNLQTKRAGRIRRLGMILMALGILLPSLYGFGTKFLEFIALYRGDVEGVFAITPILNYLLASLGFLCLFGWAALGGMFHDVEQPKHAMLENETRLDRVAPWRQQIGLEYPRRQNVLPASPGTATEHHRFKGYYEQDN